MAAAAAAPLGAAGGWLDWIAHLGHDVYTYPPWISEQQLDCSCHRTPALNFSCVIHNGKTSVDWRTETSLTSCGAKL